MGQKYESEQISHFVQDSPFVLKELQRLISQKIFSRQKGSLSDCLRWYSFGVVVRCPQVILFLGGSTLLDWFTLNGPQNNENVPKVQ